MKSFLIHVFSGMLLIFVLTACNAAKPQEFSAQEPMMSFSKTTNTPTPTRAQTSTLAQTAVHTPVNSGFTAHSELTEKARQDLAKKLRVPLDNITVRTVIGLEFSTEAFYCRTTKERISKEESPQAISGLSILLDASGRRYEYHASNKTVIFCRSLP